MAGIMLEPRLNKEDLVRIMRFFAPIGAVLGLLALSALPVQALTAACQADLDQHAQVRLKIIERINGFSKRRPTAQLACTTFGQLVESERKMLDWMEANREWCQLPETLIEDFKNATSQSGKARAQTCEAAKREASGQGSAPRQNVPGGGVSLPKGAL